MVIPITTFGDSAADSAVTWFTFPCRGALGWAGRPCCPACRGAGERRFCEQLWHNDLFARIGSTCGGGEWRYMVDLHVNLESHLASFLLLALWTPCDRVAESHS